MKTTIIGNTLEKQASALRLMGVILRHMPEKEWIERLIQERIFETIPYASRRKCVMQAQLCMKRWESAYSEESYNAAYADYMNLFIGPGKPLAPPWESIYVSKDRNLVFQKETLDVRKYYRKHGLEIGDMYREPDDHIAYELEFVATLADRAFLASEQGHCGDYGRYMKAKTGFLQEHLFRWVFDWCGSTASHAETDFYRAVALFVQGFLEEIQTE